MDRRQPEPSEVLGGFLIAWTINVLLPRTTGRWQLAGRITARRVIRHLLLRWALNAVALLVVVPAVRRWSEDALRRHAALAAELGREPTTDELMADWSRRHDDAVRSVRRSDEPSASASSSRT